MWNNKNSIEDMIIFEDKDILVCHKAALRIDGRDYDAARLGELVALYRKILGGVFRGLES